MKTFYLMAAIGIILLSFSSSSAQSDVLTHVRSNTFFVGWDNTGTSGSLEIRNDFTQPINFFTNGSQQATILSNGNVGIGTAFSPTFKLDIDAGDINLTDDYFSYRIDGNPVLWYWL